MQAEEAQEQNVVVDQDDSQRDGDMSLELARPWPRFWARMFDILLYSLIGGLVVGAAFPEFLYYDIFQGPWGELAIGIVFLPIVMLVDAASLSIWKTSPGKLIAGIRVVRREGGAMPMDQSIMRNMICYLKGLGLGIPLVNLATYIASYERLSKQGATAWDEQMDTIVLSHPNDGTRTWIAAICFIGLNGALNLL